MESLETERVKGVNFLATPLRIDNTSLSLKHFIKCSWNFHLDTCLENFFKDKAFKETFYYLDGPGSFKALDFVSG